MERTFVFSKLYKMDLSVKPKYTVTSGYLPAVGLVGWRVLTAAAGRGGGRGRRWSLHKTIRVGDPGQLGGVPALALGALPAPQQILVTFRAAPSHCKPSLSFQGYTYTVWTRSCGLTERDCADAQLRVAECRQYFRPIFIQTLNSIMALIFC